jgi:hypothetical protein
MQTEYEADSSYLGQFIPLHYHHNMLMDARRMRGFKSAIDYMVPEGGKVLDLGGGTGVLSWFAALKADKVWCVEMNRTWFGKRDVSFPAIGKGTRWKWCRPMPSTICRRSPWMW